VERLGRSGQVEAVPALLLAVADESWPVRQAAAEHLAAFPTRLLLPVLESALRDDENAGMRNAAMEIYVRLGAAVVPALLALLGDPDEEVRNFAAVMLGSSRDPRAVEPLIEALADRDVNVRHAAATGLGQIGDARAVPPLIAALRSEPWLQYPAVGALAEIGDAQAAPRSRAAGDELLPGALEALGRLAGGTLRVVRTPIPAAQHGDQAVVAISSVPAGGRPRPGAAALRHQDLVDHLLATRPMTTTEPAYCRHH
jgi:HEAT repeat protein